MSSKRDRRADTNYKHHVHKRRRARSRRSHVENTRRIRCVFTNPRARVRVYVRRDLNDSSDKTRITGSCAARRSNSYQPADFFLSSFLLLLLVFFLPFLLLPLLRSSAQRGVSFFWLPTFSPLPLSLVQARDVSDT